MARTASKAAPKASRTFAQGVCHHRDAAGKPDCRKRIEGKGANLCPAHQKQWAEAARARAAARKAAAAPSQPATMESEVAKVRAMKARRTPPAPKREPVARAAMVAVEPTVTKVD